MYTAAKQALAMLTGPSPAWAPVQACRGSKLAGDAILQGTYVIRELERKRKSHTGRLLTLRRSQKQARKAIGQFLLFSVRIYQA